MKMPTQVLVHQHERGNRSKQWSVVRHFRENPLYRRYSKLSPDAREHIEAGLTQLIASSRVRQSQIKAGKEVIHTNRNIDILNFSGPFLLTHTGKLLDKKDISNLLMAMGLSKKTDVDFSKLSYIIHSESPAGFGPNPFHLLPKQLNKKIGNPYTKPTFVWAVTSRKPLVAHELGHSKLWYSGRLGKIITIGGLVASHTFNPKSEIFQKRMIIPIMEEGLASYHGYKGLKEAGLKPSLGEKLALGIPPLNRIMVFVPQVRKKITGV